MLRMEYNLHSVFSSGADADTTGICWDTLSFHCCRALSAGCSAPLLVCPSHESYPLAERVTALGALHATYVVCYEWYFYA